MSWWKLTRPIRERTELSSNGSAVTGCKSLCSLICRQLKEFSETISDWPETEFGERIRPSPQEIWENSRKIIINFRGGIMLDWSFAAKNSQTLKPDLDTWYRNWDLFCFETHPPPPPPPSLVSINFLRTPGARAIFLHSNVLYNSV